MKARKELAFVIVAFLFVLSACGNNSGINANSQDTAEENVKDQTSDNSGDTDSSGASANAGGDENTKLGGVSFEIIDSNTVKALINDPYILARATDMMQIQLKLFPDEASIERHEGSFAFKMDFYGEGEPRDCNAFPQTCRIESDGESNRIIDEDIIGPNGAPVVGGGIADDTKISFVVHCEGIADIISSNPYYATYIDYEEYTRGKMSNPVLPTYVKPDLSQTSLQGQVDESFFSEVFFDYFVIEQDFGKYMSYSNHAFFPGVGRKYEGQIIWAPSGNSEISKKGLIIGSIDDFGVANYYVAMVYDSHRDLMRDYVENGEVNMTLEYGMEDIETAEIKDEMLMRFLPESGSDYYGTWEYKLSDNVLYWHYTPGYEEHYRSEDGFFIPDFSFDYSGHIIDGLHDTEAIKTVLDQGSVKDTYEYRYYWDDMSYDYSNNTEGTATVSYTGNLYKNKDDSETSASAKTEDEAIREETLRIRNEYDQQAEKERQEKMNAPQTVDPSATCYIYDNDSTDFVLSGLDMNLLTDGGAYEIDFSGYTLRVTAAVQDDPESVLGKYNGEAFEFIEEMSCYINLESAPNCITVNANLRNIDNLTWDIVDGFTFYECDNKGARRKIEKEVSISDWR